MTKFVDTVKINGKGKKKGGGGGISENMILKIMIELEEAGECC